MWSRSFGGPDRSARIDLSTSSATSSSDLLTTVRAERLAREQHRQEELSARLIQRVWRGRREAARAREELLDRLVEDVASAREEEEDDAAAGPGKALARMQQITSTVIGAGKIRALGGTAAGNRKARTVLDAWVKLAVQVDTVSGTPLALAPLQVTPDHLLQLQTICIYLLEAVHYDPRTATAANMLACLELILTPESYASLDSETAEASKVSLVRHLSGHEWVKILVEALEKLIAASLPRKKHPHIASVIRLILAPLSLVPLESAFGLLPPLVNELLALPALPSCLPLPSVTHLSRALPLFDALLPLAAQQPEIIASGRMTSETGKTFFLANLVTLGITGGMLERSGPQGLRTWTKVVGQVLAGVDEGWGRWAEGELDDEDEGPSSSIRQAQGDDSDSDVDMDSPVKSRMPAAVRPPGNHRRPHRRALLPANISSKVLLLASPAHLSPLIDQAVQRTTAAGLVDFAVFVLGLLSAFRGSTRYEAVLDALLGGGPRTTALVKRLWRECVRVSWRDSQEQVTWDRFSANPAGPPLALLTTMYNHYLLITPDDEFFADGNPLSLDEVVHLSGIWRDLAFWGYMSGVRAPGAPVSQRGAQGTEEERAAFTRGVTRVSERNARRPFAPADHWVMKNQMDLKGFVAAAVYEETELVNGQEQQIAPVRNARHRSSRAAALTKRQIAYLSPRLGLLNNLPMAVPFRTRLEVFSQFVEADERRWSYGYTDRVSAKIRRTHLAQDGFDHLNDQGPNLKKPIYIKFYDQHGNREAGIDGGGLFKEFMTNLCKEVFEPNRGLWLTTDQNQLYPNPHSYAKEPHQLQWYAFIGRVLGKAMYEGMLVDVSFANFFLAKWMGRQPSLDDLASLDKDIYRSLNILKNYPKPEELALTFSLTEDNFGETRTIDLVHGGSDIPVTLDNRQEYIQLVCKYKMDRQIAPQCRAFFNGLNDLIDPKWLRMFDQQELQQLIGGEETMIDIDELRKHSSWSGFASGKTVEMFWSVVKGFNQDERRALLRFVTSCPRPPLLGFAHLDPQFQIRKGDSDLNRLPTASACFNQLKMPEYDSQEVMRKKLLQAITSGAGFDLS